MHGVGVGVGGGVVVMIFANFKAIKGKLKRTLHLSGSAMIPCYINVEKVGSNRQRRRQRNKSHRIEMKSNVGQQNDKSLVKPIDRPIQCNKWFFPFKNFSSRTRRPEKFRKIAC